MVFFLKVQDFLSEITNIRQQTRDFWFGFIFLEILKIHRLVWIFLWILGCFVSISPMFNFDLYKYSLYEMLLYLLKTSFERIFVVYYASHIILLHIFRPLF